MDPSHDSTVSKVTVALTAHARATVTLVGDVDPPAARVLGAVLSSLFADDGARVVLDLRRVDVFGSAALSAVVGAERSATDGELVLRDVPDHVRQVLRISGLDDFEVVSSGAGDVDREDEAATDDPPPPHIDVLPLRRDVEDLVRRASSIGREAICVTTTELDAPGPRILHVNTAFSEMTGWDARDVVGRDPRFLQGPLTDRRELDRLRADLEHGRAFSGETVNYRRDGTPFVMNWRIVGVDADPHPVFIAHQTDATELRRLLRFDTATTVVDEVIDSTSRPSDLRDCIRASQIALLGSGRVFVRTTAPDGEVDGDRPEPPDGRVRELLSMSLGRAAVTIMEPETSAFVLDLDVGGDGDVAHVRVVADVADPDVLRLSDLRMHLEVLERSVDRYRRIAGERE